MKSRCMHLSMAIIVGLCALVPVPAALAGNLQPSGPPGPTMKTLDQIPPTWSVTYQCVDSNSSCPRFQLVMNGAAVLDKETGLVWEQAPSLGTNSWQNADLECRDNQIAGRLGWRLPSVEELASLVDTSATNPALAPGNPFSGVSLDHYWTSTYAWTINSTGTPAHFAYTVTMGNGVVSADQTDIIGPGTAIDRIWCVRGGRGNENEIPYELQ